MTAKTNRFYAYALTLCGAAISIASIGGASYANAVGISLGAPVSCEVLSEKINGSFALQAIYHAETATHGSYQFSVKSVGGPNNTNINQSGGFSANAKESIVLGEMTLAGSSIYDVTLKIDANGTSHECGGRIGAA